MRRCTTGAFTLIELIMIIAIIGILVGIAAPRLFDFTADAKAAAEKGVAAGVSAGIYTYYMQNRTLPPALDSAIAGQPCSISNPCFTTVLAQGGITQEWAKISGISYVGPTGKIYTYDNAIGSFN